MRNIKLIVEYAGTNYCGWQKQKNAISVQEKLEQALEKLLGCKTVLQGSGRTDAGVHALGQVANFTTTSDLPNYKIVGGLNEYLPNDIAVLSATDVPLNFHAQHSAKKKTYKYICYSSHVARPTKTNLAMQIGHVSVDAMRSAAVLLLGEHDFASFAGSKNIKESTVRTITNITIERNDSDVIFHVTGNGFLHNMVRIIVGTLLDVGSKRIMPENVKNILESKDRRLASKTAAACGLYLVDVEY